MRKLLHQKCRWTKAHPFIQNKNELITSVPEILKIFTSDTKTKSWIWLNVRLWIHWENGGRHKTGRKVSLMNRVLNQISCIRMLSEATTEAEIQCHLTEFGDKRRWQFPGEICVFQQQWHLRLTLLNLFYKGLTVLLHRGWWQLYYLCVKIHKISLLK